MEKENVRSGGAEMTNPTPSSADVIGGMREALRKIGLQKLTSEQTEKEIEWGDFQGAYDTMIGVARAALPDSRPDNQGGA